MYTKKHFNFKSHIPERPTSWSPLSGFFTYSHALPLLQLPTEVTGAHLLWGILGRLPEIEKTLIFCEQNRAIFRVTESKNVVEQFCLQSIFLNVPHCLANQQCTLQRNATKFHNSIPLWSADLYLILVWPGRSRLEYCLDRALKSPSPLPLPPLAGSNVGLAAVVIFYGSAEANT